MLVWNLNLCIWILINLKYKPWVRYMIIYLARQYILEKKNLHPICRWSMRFFSFNLQQIMSPVQYFSLLRIWMTRVTVILYVDHLMIPLEVISVLLLKPICTSFVFASCWNVCFCYINFRNTQIHSIIQNPPVLFFGVYFTSYCLCIRLQFETLWTHIIKMNYLVFVINF